MIDFSWQSPRASGILMHISSLPSNQGIGSFGVGADLFLKFLSESGMKYWQICPLSPTGYGDSPYQSFSAFAGNPYFIDFEELFECGLIDERDMFALNSLPKEYCDYGKIYETIPSILRKASTTPSAKKIFKSEISYEKFCEDNAYWLENYAEFCALKKRFGGRAWYEWDDKFKMRKSYKLEKSDEQEIESVKFAQWVFFSQYAKLKAKAKSLNIEIIGDIPIFLARDSADVWANPSLFELDEKLNPIRVAGVGPDYFSPTGQLWGNPLYDWKKSYTKIVAFWKARLKKSFELYDVLRIDHFRAFADYWAIPADSENAISGKWEKGPNLKFFKEIRETFQTEKFIAEDLGLLSKEAVKLAQDLNIPTMAVLQFAFSGDSKNTYLPHNLKRNLVCYTGTHDNDTANSWYTNADEKTKDTFRCYFATDASLPSYTLTLSALTSVAQTAIIPMQDILDKGAGARMNTPGVANGNWQWRVQFAEIESAINLKSPNLRKLCEISDRLNQSQNSQDAIFAEK